MLASTCPELADRSSVLPVLPLPLQASGFGFTLARITSRPSRTRFAGRLNSGVRLHGKECGYTISKAAVLVCCGLWIDAWSCSGRLRLRYALSMADRDWALPIQLRSGASVPDIPRPASVQPHLRSNMGRAWTGSYCSRHLRSRTEALMSMQPNNSFKPNPLRGSA